MTNEVKTNRGKERVYGILDGLIEPENPVPDSSLLKKISSKESPDLIGPEKPLIGGSLRVCIALIMLFALQAADTPLFLRIAAMLAAASLAFDAGIRALDAQRRLKRVTLDLHAPLLELKSVRDHLNTYLENVDRRTSRYFHCVTSTKLTTFCVLRQMQGALEERITKIEKLLSWPTCDSISEAFDDLKQVLLFRDGVIRDTGQVFTSALHELRSKIDLLIDDLDSGLKVLEDTIKVPRRAVEDDSKVN